MCRRVIPVEERIGARVVDVRRLEKAGVPKLGAVVAVVPALLRVAFDVALDDDSSEEVRLLVTDAAAKLGALEDQIILKGHGNRRGHGGVLGPGPGTFSSPPGPVGTMNAAYRVRGSRRRVHSSRETARSGSS